MQRPFTRVVNTRFVSELLELALDGILPCAFRAPLAPDLLADALAD
ncbi:MAG: hypothetical protein LBV34_24825 [Nocardiopsaceae bacterium]|nr:hypothetical protein [Nocardiopsaceae bacterium]